MTKKNKDPGIYKITNIATGAIYIGQSLTISARWHNHDYHLGRGTHRNSYLQRAYNKYGKESFIKTVEEDLTIQSQSLSSKELQNLLNLKEIETLKKYEGQVCYNLMRAGISGVIASDYTKKLLSSLNKKKWQSKEYRARLSEAHKLVHKDLDFSARRAASISKAKSTPHEKQKISKRFTDLWQDANYKKQTSKAIKKGWSDPQVLQDQSTRSRASWQDPEVKARRIKGLKEAWIRRKSKT